MDQAKHVLFGERLQQERKRKGMRQQDLADKLGVHRNTISRWEQGDQLPDSKGVVLELAYQLGLDGQQGRLLLEASLTAQAPYWQVPYQRNPLFTGREEVFEQLHAALCEQQTVSLCGLAGMGKTQTALEYVYRHANEYAAVFWIGAETEARLLADILACAEVLSLPQRREQDQGEVLSAVQRWLARHRDWLLVLDNVEDLELVKCVLPAARSGAVLLTTRLQALGTVAQTIDLEKMSTEEGVRFLLRRAKVAERQLGAAEEEAAREVVAAMDGLPLALDQAGAYIAAACCGCSEYLQIFKDHTLDLLAEREAYVEHPASVVKTFVLTFKQLQACHPEAADLLTVCAFLAPDAIPEELFLQGASQLGAPFEQMATRSLQFHTALKDVLACSLIQRHTGNTEHRMLVIHRLVQAVLRARLDARVQQNWITRIIRALNHVFPAGEAYLKRWRREHWSQSEQWLPHVLEVASLSKGWNLTFPEVSSLLIKVAVYLAQRARYADAESLLQQALGLRAQANPDLAGPLTALGEAYSNLGKNAEPLLRQAVRLLEDALGEGHSEVAYPLSLLGALYTQQGKYAQAEPLLLRALRIQEQRLGDAHPKVSHVLGTLGFLYTQQGRYEEAEPLLLRAQRIREQTVGETHPDLAHTLNNLGFLYRHQGKYAQAETLLERALSIREQERDETHPDVAQSLSHLGWLYKEQGQYERAEVLLQHALHLREQVMGEGHPAVALILTHVGALYSEQGRYEEAEPLLQRALCIREQFLDASPIRTAESLYELAELYRVRRKLRDAESLYLRALTIRERHLGAEHNETCETRERYLELVRTKHLASRLNAFVQREGLARLRDEQALTSPGSGQYHLLLPEKAESLHEPDNTRIGGES